jgi:hypothetical protein
MELPSEIIAWREVISDGKKDAGEIPEQTCPAIDNILRDIKSFRNDLDYYKRNARHYETPEALAADLPDLDDLESELENLRESNAQLRHLGEYWYQIASSDAENAIYDTLTNHSPAP